MKWSRRHEKREGKGIEYLLTRRSCGLDYDFGGRFWVLFTSDFVMVSRILASAAFER